MEPIIVTGKPPAAPQEQPESSLDLRVIELVSTKQWQHKKEKSLQEHADTACLPFPLLKHPLQQRLSAPRQGDKASARLMLVPQSNTKDPLQEGLKRPSDIEKRRATVSLVPVSHAAADMSPVGNKRAAETPPVVNNRAVEMPVVVNKKAVDIPLPNMLPPTREADGVRPLSIRHLSTDQPASAASVRKATVEKKMREESGVTSLPVPQSAAKTSTHVQSEAPMATPHRPQLNKQTTETVTPQQSAMIYRFSRWGGDYAVTVQGQTGGSLLLQPSNAIVAQQLSEQWQSGNPQKWQLARDGSEGKEQRHQQQQQNERDET